MTSQQPYSSLAVFRPVIFSLLVSALLTACGGHGLAPVDDKGRPLTAGSDVYQTVTAGDTLYSIAWDTGQDYRQLAKRNRIRSPYLIKPGQRLLISSGRAKASKSVSKSTVSAISRSAGRTHVVSRGDTLYSISRRAGLKQQTVAKWNGLQPPYTLKPGQTLRLAGPADTGGRRQSTDKTRQNRPSVSSKKPSKNAPIARSAIKTRWQWPARGRVLSRFNAKAGRKGIDIAGRQGQPIKAASGGKVVYKGSGLRGYGNLVIIKHNRDFLSAYAHCNKILVNEGDVIKHGKQIASIGSSGTNRAKLHFEIRYRGNPVNPMKYLPKR